MVGQPSVSSVNTPVVQAEAPKPINKLPTDINQTILLDQTNARRVEAGLPIVKLDPRLNQSAQAKCDDMVARDYWNHNAPDGTEPWVFMQSANVVYKEAGENLARGYSDATQTVIGWMNSPTHKSNLLAPGFDHVGFGVCKSESALFRNRQLITVQHFIND